MPMFKIYVGNLNPASTADQLRKIFAPYLVVEDVALATDKKTGKFRGFATVMTRDEPSARIAINKLNGTVLDGRRLVVNEINKGPDKLQKRPRKGPPGQGGGPGQGGQPGQGNYRQFRPGRHFSRNRPFRSRPSQPLPPPPPPPAPPARPSTGYSSGYSGLGGPAAPRPQGPAGPSTPKPPGGPGPGTPPASPGNTRPATPKPPVPPDED